MRALLHVAARTLVERRTVLAAAAVAALLPLLAPLLPGTGSSPAADARGAAATIIGAGFALVVALLHGATCVARDLRERRLSFYLARPLSAGSLWFGRVLAGVSLSGATLLIAWLPTIVLDPTSAREVSLPPGLVGSVLAILLAAVVLGHALAVMLASRSAWLAVDVAALATIATAAALLLRTILGTGATKVFGYTLWSTLAAVVVALVLAGLAQVAHGRSDARRGHRALSVALWGVLAAAVGLLGGYTVFLTHPSPGSLRRLYELGTPPAGDYLSAAGTCAWRGDYQARFLLDTAGGGFVRVAPGTTLASDVVLAPDGGTAFWLEDERGPRPPTARLVRCDLRAPQPRPQATAVVITVGGFVPLAVSAGGDLVAIQNDSLVSVFDATTGAVRASFRLPAGEHRAGLDFVGSDRLRVEQPRETDASGTQHSLVLALDLRTGQVVETGSFGTGSEIALYRRLSAEHPVVVASRNRGDVLGPLILDAWTGVTIADLGSRRNADQAPAYWGPRVAFLAGGGHAAAELDETGVRVRLYSADWQPGRAFDLGHASYLALGAEVEPGRLPVVVTRRVGTRRTDFSARRECLLLDLANGIVTPLDAETRPLSTMWWAIHRRSVEPLTPAARMFVTDRGAFAVWDPATHELRTVLETGW